jgi:uncharacterized protein with FMN-binding domain
MSTRRSRAASRPGRALRRTFVSGFVVASYIAYAIHEHMAVSAQVVATVPPTPRQGQDAQQQDPSAQQQSQSPTSQPQDQSAQQQSQSPTSQPQDGTDQSLPGQSAPAPTATPQPPAGSTYRDGTYTGPSVNAFYGQVQVRVVISGGRIKSVTFLNYPSDRRTSVRINTFAVPYLQSEAIQAQSANVDVISGATLTSEAFMISLQSALDNARG